MRYHAGPTLKDEVVTVGGTDDDFSTIQKAIDWFKRYRITGSCRIDIDAGSWDEAVVFEDLLVEAGASLTLRGDTRELAGLSYVDGAVCNPAGLTNGGSGACGLANAGTDITVTGAGGNPDFDADGWDSGDTILVYDNAGATTEETIDSVANNVITLTGAAPAVGNDATAILLIPDRRIERSSAGRCVQADYVRGIVLKGIYAVTATGADCDGIVANLGAEITCENVATLAEDSGFLALAHDSTIYARNGAISSWGAARGLFSFVRASINCRYSTVVDCTDGINAQLDAFIRALDCVAVNCGEGFVAILSRLDATDCTARQCTTGYDATFGGYIYAPSTNANNNGNGADYDPLPAGFPGSNQGNDYAVVYAS